MHPLFSVAVAFGLAGCAAHVADTSQTSNWKRVSGAGLNCVSFAPANGEPVDRNVLLRADFEANLVGQLHVVEPVKSRCWYESPNGSIRLWTGGLCGDGIEAHFEERGDAWKLASEWPIYITCQSVTP